MTNKTTEPQLDDASYDEGRAAFKAGASIRGIVEACVTADTPLSEAKTFSAALGFADAALDKLRGIER